MPTWDRREEIFLGMEQFQGWSNDFYTPLFGETGSLNSAGHYGWPRFPEHKDVGGGLDLVKSDTFPDLQPTGLVKRQGYSDQVYSGMMTAGPPGSVATPSGATGASRGAEAYAKMRPTKPSMAGLNAIYELKDLPGMLRQRMVKSGLKNVSNYFLAYQFGWQPLFNDIKDMIFQQKKIESRIDWLFRNSGKSVRTSIELANSTSGATTSSGAGGMYPNLVTQYYVEPPTYQEILTTGDRLWASARWRIHMPNSPGNVAYKRALMAELYGLYPSPSKIYNMIPWTWLIDWFSNTGYLIENLEATLDSRIAAEYFYVMRETWGKRKRTARCTLMSFNDYPVKITSTSRRERSIKTRLRGNPFGFSVQSNLSGMQTAILGALGISKLT